MSARPQLCILQDGLEGFEIGVDIGKNRKLHFVLAEGFPVENKRVVPMRPCANGYSAALWSGAASEARRRFGCSELDQHVPNFRLRWVWSLMRNSNSVDVGYLKAENPSISN